MSARVMLMAKPENVRGIIGTATAFEGEAWWLVEAESAHAARKVIEHFERDPNATCVHGRVLEHGGGK